ncbi:MAG TPA: IPT/TIG domain-containing protein [Candidatus Acidoferrales bacterium]|nr:IPT/TIG domain-containing protein [Candidatus Acidoferrales bacterium]
MDRLRLGAPACLVLPLVCAACGGGSSVQTAPPPPPPSPDFVLGLSSNSISVTQGASSNAVNVSVNGTNGFNGSVQVTLSGMPNGVTSNPASPFAVSAGASVPVIFGATQGAATGSFNLSAQGSSGNLSHNAALTLVVQSGVAAALPRTTFVRTDGVRALDDPAGEWPHRHLVYDAARKQLYVANRAMNRVEVFSTATQAKKAAVSVAGASSAELSADGKTLWVGTVTEEIAAVNPDSLQVVSRTALMPQTPMPGSVFDRPEEVVALGSGNLLVRLREANQPESLLAMWNSATNALTNLTPTEPALFANGLGAMARTGDRTKVLVASSNSSGSNAEVAVYDGNGNVAAGPRGLGTGSVLRVAANGDGSRFAVAMNAGGTAELLLLDGALNPVAGPAPMNAGSMTFSRDGRSLYVNQAGSAAVSLLDANDLHLLGTIADAEVEGVPSEFEDADETGLIFGLGNRGVSFVDASQTAGLPAATPSFAGVPVAQPAEGLSTGGTGVTLAGQNFSALQAVKLGAQSASGAVLNGATQIQLTSPPSATGGAVNATAYFANGWVAIAPDAFSYGPQILEVLPNAGAPGGGETVQIYGYGLGTDVTKLSVKIGGAAATVQKIESVPAMSASIGLDATYPFGLERVTVATPAGNPGAADVVVSGPAGSLTLPRGYQFLQSEQFFGKAGFFRFITYDQSRQWLYLSNIDHVDVFDLAAKQFHASAIEPPGGPPPNSAVRGISLTPDSSKLLVADFGAQSIYLMNPDQGTGSSVTVGGVAGFVNSGPARVAATSTQSVFVGFSAEGSGSGGCSSCLGELDLTANPPVLHVAGQPEISGLTGAPLLQGTSGGDHVFVAFGSAPDAPVAAWSAASPNEFATAAANSAAVDVGASADGAIFALQTGSGLEIRDGGLALFGNSSSYELAQVPGRTLVPGVALHPSGALIYQPFLAGPAGGAGVRGGIDIFDAHSGALRMRILLAQQFLTDVDALHGEFLAIDETGQRLFAITSQDGTPQNAGVTVIQLASLPLAIGTVSPGAGPAGGGTVVTIRGSGFQSGATVKVGSKAVAVTFKDASTLTFITPALAAGAQQITVTNPNGETAALDGVYTAN